MPYKSKAQARAFFAMESRGELPKGTAKEWAHATKDIKKLPEHVKGSKKRVKKAAEACSWIPPWLISLALDTPGDSDRS